MPDAIADTSPLQYLHQLGLLDVLPQLVKHVAVPPAVVEELARGAELGVDVPDVAELHAKRADLIESVAAEIDRLQSLRFRVSPATRATVLLLARRLPAEQFDLPTLHRLRKEDAQPAEVEEAAS